jgi:tRNA threonylcarbamoyl adenosine modification protein (Sua5/YciO/YrdC/YwlC family)
MMPEFTNYVKGYQGLLDYVWYDSGHIRVKGTVPCPTEEDLNGFLPSEQYPSDHLAVVADLEFFEASGAASVPVVSPGSEYGTRLEAAYRNVALAEEALLQEYVIAVPTDTIYGIAAIASSSRAINAIYDIKRREHTKPLAVCVADHHDIADICHTDHLPDDLLRRLLPGPVTVVLDRKRNPDLLSDDLNPGVEALGVRIPDFPFLRAICRQVQKPLALTSANISGEQSPVHTSEFGHIASSCAIVFDHGVLGEQFDALQRAGSTIVDLRSSGAFKIVREGSALDKTVSILVQSGLILREELC